MTTYYGTDLQPGYLAVGLPTITGAFEGKLRIYSRPPVNYGTI